MKNPEWGIKRICQSCATKYYDLNREPVVCPKCQAVFDPAAGLKLRSDSSYKAHGGRTKSVFTGSASPEGEAASEEVEAAEDDEDKIDGDEAEDDEDPVEDISELGDDSDDLAEIAEKDELDDR